MFVAAALVTPVVLLSLFYISQMNATVQRMVSVDIELLRVGDRISLDFLQARRHEKNFLIYEDSAYLSGSHEALRRIPQLCSRGAGLDPALSPLFDAIAARTRVYGALLDSLARLPAARPGPAYREDWARLRTRHQLLLDMAEATQDSARQDSLLAEASQLASELVLPLRGGPLGRIINEHIRTTEEAVTNGTDSIITHANQRMTDNQARVRRLSEWSQRNIITTLLVVLVLLLWLVARMPRRIVLPIKRIANALTRAEQGDLDVRITVDARDELGQLARQLNRAFANLRGFDERKVERLLLLERRFRLLAADISEGVLLFDRKPNVIFANAAVEPLLGRPATEAAGHALAEFPLLGPLVEPLERTLAGASSRQECDILPGLPASAVCIEALRDSTGTVQAALVVITNPTPPAADETTGPGI
jgi:PAS domain-containing protein